MRKCAVGLFPCSHQADIKMNSHRLFRFDDNKPAASCQQAWWKLIIKTFIHKLDANCINNLQQVLKYLIFTELIEFDEAERHDATWTLPSSW